MAGAIRAACFLAETHSLRWETLKKDAKGGGVGDFCSLRLMTLKGGQRGERT